MSTEEQVICRNCGKPTGYSILKDKIKGLIFLCKSCNAKFEKYMKAKGKKIY